MNKEHKPVDPIKTILTVGLLLLASGGAHAETEISIQVNGVSAPEGTIVVRLYDSKKSWLKDAVVETSHELNADSTGDVVTIAVSVPPGDYAVHVYHDLDANGKMKTNFIGIPKEPTGVSNDAKGKMGPPKYKDAVLTVGADPVTVPINLTQI